MSKSTMPVLSTLFTSLPKRNKKIGLTSGSVQRVPAEILQEIFYIHVWVNLDTPVRLLLVCRSWCSAASYPVLWGRIFYGDGYKYRKTLSNDLQTDDGCGMGSVEMGMGTIGNIGVGLCDRIDGMVHCSTTGSLNRAIARTGNTKFELTVYGLKGQDLRRSYFGQKFGILDAEALSSRCRLLRLITSDAMKEFISWMGHLGKPMALASSEAGGTQDIGMDTAGRGQLDALEEFIYLGRMDVPISAGLTMEILQTRCPRLHTLDYPYIEDNHHTRALLPRLRKLSTSDMVQTLSNPVNTADSRMFQSMEEFHIRHSNPRFTPSSRIPALRKASIIDVPLHTFAVEFFRQLTHLTVGNSYRANLMFSIETLPLLTYLAIYGELGFIHQLQAPNLVTLIIRDIKKYGTYQWNFSRFTSRTVGNGLSPEILHVDSIHDFMTAREYVEFIRKIGRKVKEMYITHVREGETISTELAAGLLGGAATRGEVDHQSQERTPICPLLERLDVLLPQPGHWSDQGITKKNLQQLVDLTSNGAPEGSPPLRRIRYGIYPPTGRRRDTLNAHRKWWMIKWEDLVWIQ